MYSTNITDSIYLTQQIKSECTKIDGNADLLHGDHANFVKRIDINNSSHTEDAI